MLSTFSGCNSQQAVVDTVGLNSDPISQFAVALNPILLFDEQETVIAFNDIKDAVVLDQKGNSITALSQNTGWSWVYKKENDWKIRNVYALEKWRNGRNVANSKFSAYTFCQQGSIAVMPIATAGADVKTFANEELANAILAVSVSGEEKEALCYKINQDGVMHIPENKITALSQVEGLKADFLEKDTNNKVAISYVLNERVIWAGEISSANTELVCPDTLNISVKAGDIFFIAIQLNGEIEKTTDTSSNDETESNEDVTNDYTSPNEDTSSQEDTVSQEDTNSNEEDSSQDNNENVINLMNGYDSTYKIVYPTNTSITQKDIINQLRVDMVKVFDADVLISTDKAEKSEYELLIGETNRKESKEVYKDLNKGRKNNASDFIIRVVNKKLVIAANTDYALQLATSYFMKNYCKTDRDSVATNLNYVSKPKLKTITIDNEDISKYIIRTEKYPSLLTLRAAEKLAEYIISKTGYELEIKSSDTASKYEILVGLTTASGIKSSVFKSQSLDYLNGYDLDAYKVYVKNKKLFIEGGSTYASNLAVSKLITKLNKSGNLSKSFVLSGKYKSGEYTLTDGYAYTWGDEFLSTNSTLSRKSWNIDAVTRNGPWYHVDDPYYKASKKSLSDSNPNNDFGGPWTNEFYDSGLGKKQKFAQEGTTLFGNKVGQNYWIKNNALVMNAKKTDEGYTACGINTKGLMEFRYGILEARVIMATNNGSAATFWTRSRDGGTWVNEFDLCENFGIDKISPNMHTWGQGGAYHVDHGAKKQIQLREEMFPRKNEHFYDTYHYLTMEWTPEMANFYLDGELYLSQEITTENWQAFAENTYLLFDCRPPATNYNLWNGSYNPGNYLMENINKYCENMYIDNVRVYQIDSRQYSLRAKK